MHDTFKKLQKQAAVDGLDEKGNIVKKTVPVIYKQEFREQMGILGQQENAFLADRIFEVFVVSKNGMITFE